MTANFSFGPASPVNGLRGIDENARMWIRIDWQAACRECICDGRRWSPIA